MLRTEIARLAMKGGSLAFLQFRGCFFGKGESYNVAGRRGPNPQLFSAALQYAGRRISVLPDAARLATPLQGSREQEAKIQRSSTPRSSIKWA
jgi:hypothetical protein